MLSSDIDTSLYSSPSLEDQQEFEYDVQLEVSYNSNETYRECLRTLFNMRSQRTAAAATVTNDEDEEEDVLDEETRDENDYDGFMCCKFMDYIYFHTKSHPVFVDLYETAAAVMMSTDTEIGLVVLFSYDYFPLFHLVLCDFFRATKTTNHHTFTTDNEHVQAVKNKFKRSA